MIETGHRADTMKTLRERMLTMSDSELLGACRVDVFRGSGPGGQKRNKTETAIRVRHESGISGQSDKTRSQHQNRALALRQLRKNVALELREPVALEAYQAPAALEAWLRPKAELIGPKHARYFEAVAELLDLLWAVNGAIGEAAKAIGASSSALTKLVFSDAQLAQRVNALRKKHDLRPLRDPRAG
jgi:hypothetical protein